MIEISELTSKDIGRWATYTPSAGPSERGRIKDWNGTYIFVVYKCDGRWADSLPERRQGRKIYNSHNTIGNEEKNGKRWHGDTEIF